MNWLRPQDVFVDDGWWYSTTLVIWVIWFWEQVWAVDWTGWVRCISVESTLAFRSLLDPDKAAVLAGRVLFPPGKMKRKEERAEKAKEETSTKVSIINNTVKLSQVAFKKFKINMLKCFWIGWFPPIAVAVNA